MDASSSKQAKIESVSFSKEGKQLRCIYDWFEEKHRNHKINKFRS